MRPMPELKVEKVPTDQLLEYKNNAKLHPSEQVDQIASSIEEFGFNSPILAWHNNDGEPEVIAGHGRLMAARKLGMTELPVVFLDHMTEEQRRAYILVDNQLTMNSGFDFGILQSELAEISDIDMTEFDFYIAPQDIEEPYIEDVHRRHEWREDEKDDHYKRWEPEGRGQEETEQNVDEVETPKSAEPRVKLGDLWKLGNHRLMCGDSTNEDCVSKLMGENRADICFTSPPYNMGQGGIHRLKQSEKVQRVYLKRGCAYKSVDDNLSDEQYTCLLMDTLENALKYSDDAMFNIGITAGSKRGISQLLSSFKDNICDVIVWSKPNAIPLGLPSQAGMLSHPCEFIFCFNQKGNRSFSHPQWEIGMGKNVIQTRGATSNEFASEHNATFPVEFAAKVVGLFSENSVLDLFGGTGTTLMAAEQLNRTCYMMELDPHCCDIIIERWERFTGETAEKVDV